MKKRDIVEGIVERVDFPNKGVIMLEDGTKCIVKNALPGQKISAQIQKLKKNKAEARLLEVIEEDSDAVKSPCRHFGQCGGCNYLSMPYIKELGLKEQQVRGLLAPILDAQSQPYTWEGIKASPAQFGYRNKMEFTFGDEELDGPLALGMHKRGSFYDIVSVTDCQIVDDDYRQILRTVLGVFSKDYDEGRISFYHRMKQVGYLRHLLVRKAAKTGEILIDIITTTQETHDLTPFVDALLDLKLDGRIVGILHTANDSLSDAVKNDGTEILYGVDFFYEELLGLKFRITPFSFFQTNSLSAEVLYDTVRDYVSGVMGGKNTGILYDLYCGTGTISQLMSPVSSKVIGVEIVEEAVTAAKENAEMNGITNCEFIADDVLKALDNIEEKPDFIILDPPRDGVNPKALRKILDYGVQNIVYVSCKPTSLARDLEIMEAAGYYVRRCCCCDQFPWTVHCETIVLLSREAEIIAE